MGLDVSHDAFHGAYSAFNRFRQFICAVMGEGNSFPPHFVFTEEGDLERDDDGRVKYVEGFSEDYFYIVLEDYPRESNPGLYAFLEHSDWDGDISPEMCIKVADELEALLPAAEQLKWRADGHIGRDGGYVAVMKRFIAGCRKAAEANEPLRFG